MRELDKSTQSSHMTSATYRSDSPSVPGVALGILRLGLGLPIVVLGSIITVVLSLWPLRFRDSTLAAWVATVCCRVLLWVFGVQFDCPAHPQLRTHQGFVFANHSSYADVFLPMAIRPMRFLAAQEYLAWPFFGWAAKAAGAIGVDRSSTRSRAQSLLSLAKLERTPPIGLFPEGGIGPLYELQPFYHGVFKLCVENQIPYALCTIVYNEVDVLGWRNEHVAVAIWRLVTQTRLQRARLEVLQIHTPSPEANPRQLAVEAHRAVAACLGYAAKM